MRLKIFAFKVKFIFKNSCQKVAERIDNLKTNVYKKIDNNIYIELKIKKKKR